MVEAVTLWVLICLVLYIVVTWWFVVPLWHRIWEAVEKDGYSKVVYESDIFGQLVLAAFLNLLVLISLLISLAVGSYAGVVVFAVYILFWLTQL